MSKQCLVLYATMPSHLYALFDSPPETRNVLLFAIGFSGAAAVGISYTTAWCLRATSSTTYRSVERVHLYVSLDGR
jgi:hypothetical protein